MSIPCTPLRVREFTDDVISRVHLHLCLLDVHFVAKSSVKVDARCTGVVVFLIISIEHLGVVGQAWSVGRMTSARDVLPRRCLYYLNKGVAVSRESDKSRI